MIRKIIPCMFFFAPFFLASCSLDPWGVKAQERWFAERNEAQKTYESKVKQEIAERIRRQEFEESQYLESHPEVSIGTLPLDSKSASSNDIRQSINLMGFVTREPSSDDLNQAYVKIGRFQFTLKRFVASFSAQEQECKRISAYSGENLDDYCKKNIAKSVKDFAYVLKNKEINDLTKWSALNEASYGDVIDYEHASRLAVMHHKLCEDQGNQGYVEMVTSAVPCNGTSDVLNGYTARKIGLISN